MSTPTTSPPYIGAPLAEAAVLGCLLRLDVPAARALLGVLRDEDWTDPRHRSVAHACQRLLDVGVPADPVTVLGQLRADGLEKAHTAAVASSVFLVELCQAAPALGSAGHYARVVLEHSYRRRIQVAADRLAQAAATASLDDLADLVSDELEAIVDQQQRTQPPVTRPTAVAAA